MYDAVEDPYCYPGTTVLRNRAGLRDQAALDAFELDMTTQRASEPLPAGRLGVLHYTAVHRHLFGDVYPWAGKRRKVRISKDRSAFAYPENIDREMSRLFGWLRERRYLRGLPAADFARDAAHFLAELNAIHPFRERNGRTSLRLPCATGCAGRAPAALGAAGARHHASGGHRELHGRNARLAALNRAPDCLK